MVAELEDGSLSRFRHILVLLLSRLCTEIAQIILDSVDSTEPEPHHDREVLFQ